MGSVKRETIELPLTFGEMEIGEFIAWKGKSFIVTGAKIVNKSWLLEVSEVVKETPEDSVSLSDCW